MDSTTTCDNPSLQSPQAYEILIGAPVMSHMDEVEVPSGLEANRKAKSNRASDSDTSNITGLDTKGSATQCSATTSAADISSLNSSVSAITHSERAMAGHDSLQLSELERQIRVELPQAFSLVIENIYDTNLQDGKSLENLEPMPTALRSLVGPTRRPGATNISFRLPKEKRLQDVRDAINRIVRKQNFGDIYNRSATVIRRNDKGKWIVILKFSGRFKNNNNEV